MVKHVVAPNSLELAKLVEKTFPAMIPKGHSIGCPTQNTIALVIDCLRTVFLIDAKQEHAVVQIIKNATAGQLTEDTNEKLHAAAMIGAQKMTEHIDEVVEHIITETPTNGSPFAGQGVPWDPPEALYEEDDAQDAAAEDRRKKEPKKLFMSAAAYMSAMDDEKNAAQNRGRFLPKMSGLAGSKRCVRVEDMTPMFLSDLRDEMPNFAEVLDDVLIQIEARRKLDAPIKLQPILLVGKPGIGKTRFIKSLATALFCESHIFNMGGHGDVIKLKGLSKGWGNARPGDIACKLAAGSNFNPLLMIDEIDKASPTGRDGQDISSLLLSYLEHETSGAIEDDYIGAPMDLSGVNWIFAVNSIDNLPDFFLSRVDVYHVPDFTQEQKREVVKNMFNELNNFEFQGSVKNIALDAVDELTALTSAREIRRALFRAIAVAVADEREDVHASDLKKRTAPIIRQPIGFM